MGDLRGQLGTLRHWDKAAIDRVHEQVASMGMLGCLRKQSCGDALRGLNF